MLFRQLFDQDSSTYTYLLADQETGEAVIIDPVIEQHDRDATLIQELELRLLYALDTHVHADHVTGSGLLRQRFGARTVVSERAGVTCADLLVKDGDRVHFGKHELEIRETPGHTRGCLTYVMHESRMAFTGDALLIRACGRTDFQNGSSEELYRSVRERVFTLPDDTSIYPGHDYKGRTVSTVGEEKRLNPRLGGATTLADFARLMSELELPYPRKMDVAVPANLFCGIRDTEPASVSASAANWAPLSMSPVGVPEVTAEWLASNVADVLLLDVREPDEYRGELGHVAGAELMPLETLTAGTTALPRGRPIVTICRSGGRSGKAAIALGKLGFDAVASLHGGMTEWNARRLPVEHGPPPASAANRQG